MIDNMFDDVKDIGKDIKKKVGKKGFYAIVAGLGLVGVYILTRSNNNQTEYVPATGYASYPDVGTNADVVIDSINSEIGASEENIIGAIDSTENEIIQNANDLFADYTGDYMQDGQIANEILKQKVQDTMQEPPQTVGITLTDEERTIMREDLSANRNSGNTVTRIHGTGSSGTFTQKAVVSKPTDTFTQKAVVSKPSGGSTTGSSSIISGSTTQRGSSPISSGASSGRSSGSTTGSSSIISGGTTQRGSSPISSGASSGRSADTSRPAPVIPSGFASGFASGRRAR